MRDWHDAKGKALDDPPKEIVAVLCPACEWLDTAREEDELLKKPGHRPAFRWWRPAWETAADEPDE